MKVSDSIIYKSGICGKRLFFFLNFSPYEGFFFFNAVLLIKVFLYDIYYVFLSWFILNVLSSLKLCNFLNIYAKFFNIN
jgi:hypothetical protein